MRVIRDMAIGQAPSPFDIVFNASLAADAGAGAYRGGLVKIMDFDDVDHGVFVCPAALATATENIIGILEEEVANETGAGYLLDDAAYGFVRRKITPIFPTTVIRAEYVQADAAGTANYDTGATGAAASATFTCAAVGTDDYCIGGWVYFLNGANAGYLHYVTDSDGTAETLTLATALVNAVVATDDWLFINPPLCRAIDFNATYTDIKSEVDDGSWADAIQGIEYWIQAPGVGLTKLDRDKHDGLKIDNAKFFHDFTIPSSAAGQNVWISGVATS